MTHIVILFNRTQQEMSQVISDSKLNNWLKLASKETFESANLWSKLDYLFGLPIKRDPQVLDLTPIKVELGMRDSVCHTLNEKNSLISVEQIAEFNTFFNGVFRLIKPVTGNYQLHLQQFLKFNLPIEHLPPQLTDYRVQIDAAESNLKKHLTELQSWCYQQDSMWNAFYLWSRPKDEALARINLDDRTQIKTLSKLNVFKQDNVRTDIKLIVADELSSLSFDFMKMEQSFKDLSITKLTISFSDANFYHLHARDLQPWWKKIFTRF